MLLRIAGQRELLGRNRVLARSIRLRNPYVDPMSLVQVELLRRKQRGADVADLEYPMGATINGIAAGTPQHWLTAAANLCSPGSRALHTQLC